MPTQSFSLSRDLAAAACLLAIFLGSLLPGTCFLASTGLADEPGETVIASYELSDDEAGSGSSTKTPLFNGENLDGWHGQPHFDPYKLAELPDEERDAKLAEWTEEAKQHWTIENGELVNDGHGPYLTTDQEFEDYILELEYRTVPLADSGIYLKGTPQVQIWDFTETKKFDKAADKGSGGLWNNSAGAAGKNPFVLADNPLGEWNAFRIIQVGSRTTVYLNDHLVVDHAIMENYWRRGEPLPRRGPIQLQTHGGEIRWRNLSIQPLTTDQANAILAEHGSAAYKPLFNGENLDGWVGATDNYTVNEEGAIQCQAGHGGNLLTKDEYENFLLRLQFRLPPRGNNGLAIRSSMEGNPAYNAMCELQVLDNTHEAYEQLDQRQYHGSAYGMVAARRGYLRDVGQWNFQEVRVDGSTIRVELNGNVILDADVAKVTEFMGDRPHPGKDRIRGHLGFAGHNDPVEFRDIVIKELPTEEQKNPTPKKARQKAPKKQPEQKAAKPAEQKAEKATAPKLDAKPAKE